MFKIALAMCLRLYHPYPNPDVSLQHHYTLAQYEVRPAAPYTVQDWSQELQAEQVCQCITIKVSPEGNVMGTSRACKCEE
jgi:hypothetical protein